jgi:ABC-type multidrug transport system fused ATPase/permease subunit
MNLSWQVKQFFDCTFDGTSKFYPWKMPTELPKSFKLGIIVGSSGSGKSTLLKILVRESRMVIKQIDNFTF